MIWILKGISHELGNTLEMAQAATSLGVRNPFVVDEMVHRIQTELCKAGARTSNISWWWYPMRNWRK